MMGRLKSDQGQLFYEFRLGDAVPEDHLVRKIDTALAPRSGLLLCWARRRRRASASAGAFFAFYKTAIN
jgi:hypothetical protein